MTLKKLNENIKVVCGGCLRDIQCMNKESLIVFRNETLNLTIPICEKCYNNYADIANERY